MSGTKNLIRQNTRQLTQLISNSAEASGMHRCSAKVISPNWDPDYGDAELTIDATIREVTDVTSTYYYASADAQQPMVLVSGDSILAIDQTFPLASRSAGDLEVLSGTHLTGCTIENGSLDQTEENLCTEGLLDRDGSTFTTNTVVEQ